MTRREFGRRAYPHSLARSHLAFSPPLLPHPLRRVPYTNIDFTSPSGTALNGWFMQSNSSTPQPLVPIL